MKQKIISYAKKLLEEAKTRFIALELRWQIALVIIAASFLCFIFGPLYISFSARSLLNVNGLKRAETLARLASASNSVALSKGQEALYDLGPINNEGFIKDAYLTDATGLIVSPPSRFHEDARKDKVVVSAIKNAETVMSKKMIGYDIAVPVMEGSKVTGVVKITYSPMVAMPWSMLFMVIRSLLLTAGIAFGGVYCSLLLFKRTGLKDAVIPSADVQPVPEQDQYVQDPISFADHLNSPVVIFDKTFRVSYANTKALAMCDGINDKHIMDLGPEYVAAAEEIEMLQSEVVAKDSIKLWRIKEGTDTSGYGMTF